MSMRLVLRVSLALFLLWLVSLSFCVALRPSQNEPALAGAMLAIRNISCALTFLLPAPVIGIIFIHLYEPSIGLTQTPSTNVGPDDADANTSS
jgi:hypothetical protein